MVRFQSVRDGADKELIREPMRAGFLCAPTAVRFELPVAGIGADMSGPFPAGSAVIKKCIANTYLLEESGDR
jgi:hypothetical protein